MRLMNPFVLLLLMVFSCGENNIKKAKEKPKKNIVKLITTKGEIVLRLYDETPLHRDNFIKIVNDGVLDSLLFHRVIENFMIQGGDTSSKFAQPEDTVGDGDLPYVVPEEINPKLFHIKGVLGAARDDRPDRASSSTQFYITQGKVFTDSLLNLTENRINQWLSEHYVKQDPLYKAQLDSLNHAITVKDDEMRQHLSEFFREKAKTYTAFDEYTIPETHREVYKTIGGTPHLDQNYTVFGEVILGLDIVDSIAAVATDQMDRPLQDVRILKVTLE